MRHLVLVGGGHAHVEIVRRFSLRPPPDVALTVVDPNPRPIYSGMVPGFIAGEYRREELEIDLGALCRKAGATLLQDSVKAVDGAARRVHRSDGDPVSYDVASLDIGSTVAGTDLPGVREHALPSRPIPTLVSSIEALVARAKAKQPERFRVHVVGGGAGGVEIAFCLEARLRREGAIVAMTLVTEDERLLAGASRAAARAAMRAAADRGIRLVFESPVERVTAGKLQLAGGEALPTDAVLWVTGPAALPLATDSGLPVDDRGFIETSERLQVAGNPGLFAAGDCARVPGAKPAGVYAVRSAPVLDHNLRASFEGRKLRAYRPQSDFLSLLNLGDGRAIASKWGLATTGRAVLRLKDRIDRSFVEKYR